MTCNWDLRRPDVGDLAAVLALMDDPLSVHRRTACRHREAPEDEAQLALRLTHDENLVLESLTEVVGYASWQLLGDHAHLNVMAVAGTRQRQGLGALLYRAFLAEARGQGVTSISLRAYADSAWALAFYDRQGLCRVNPGDEPRTLPRGVQRYVEVASRHGQWPDVDKVLFHGPA